jgi:hypothetical protein
VNKRELDLWTDKATGENYPEPAKVFTSKWNRRVGPYVAAGQVKTFEGATELFPGLRTPVRSCVKDRWGRNSPSLCVIVRRRKSFR